MKKTLRRKLQDVSRLGDVDVLTRVSLSALKLSNGPFQKTPVHGHKGMAREVFQLAPASDCEVAAPTGPGEAIEQRVAKAPALHLRQFSDAIAFGEASALILNGKVSLPDHHIDKPNRSVADGDFLLWHGQDRSALLLCDRTPAPRTTGIALFGTGVSNWYHWLIEHLPSAFLSEKLPSELQDVPLFVPERLLAIPSFKDSLSLFAQGRPIETLDAQPYRFDDLYVIDSPVQEPFNMPAGFWPKPEDYLFHTDVMRAYRQAILDRLEIPSNPPLRRVFLARSNARRSYNQDAVLDVVQKLGFEPVFMEQLSFREQVSLMHEAAFVVGPSGASFANTLFCQPGTRLLSWLVSEYSGFCSYMNVATIADTDPRYLFATADTPIHSTSDAFASSYTLDPVKLRSALERMLDKDAQY